MSKSEDLARLDLLISHKKYEFGWGREDERSRRKAVYNDILAGFRSLEEAKEYVEAVEDKGSFYLTRGYEVPFSLLRIIIKHIEGNPSYSPWGEKPGVAPMTSSTGREGQCYELAWRHVVYYNEGTLVHGEVWSHKLGRMIGHAWVLTVPGFVYEPVSNMYFDKDELYKAYKMREIDYYMPTEARKMVLETGNFGPWTQEETRKVLTLKALPSTVKPFVKVGERVRFIGSSRSRYERWPEGKWLEHGVTGTVSEYHPESPAVTVGGELFEAIPPYAVVRWDLGGESDTCIDSEDEGKRWERISR